MLYYEFHPLKEDYETIIVSVTELEKALNPTPDFMQIKDKKKLANTFWVGNLVEDIVFRHIQNWEEDAVKQIALVRQMMNKERMRYFSPSWEEDKQFQFLYDWLEQLISLTKEFCAPWTFDIRNLRSAVEIDFSWYKVILTWEIDWWVDGSYLFDCKTAKTKWKEDEKRETSCYQARFYSWFQFLMHPEITHMAFSYLVFTKQKKIQFQNITHILDRQECEEFVKDKLVQYLTKVKQGEIEVSDGSLDRM